MKDRPLPPELYAKWGHLNFIRYTSGEWHSECPVCRDQGHIGNDPPDRFMMFPQKGTLGAAGYCRRCGHFEWADENGKPLTAEQKENTKKLRKKYAKRESDRLKKKIEWLQRQTFWLEWHEQMTEEQKQLWLREGIGEWAIDIHKLGYRPDYHVDDTDIPAMTIPYFLGDNIQTVQFRLLEENPGGKYRFLQGTSPMWFKPDPDELVGDIVLVLEGAKKALVTYQNAGLSKYRGKDISIIATPSKVVPSRLMKILNKRDPELVIWLLDPDAYEKEEGNGHVLEPAIQRNIKACGQERSLVIQAPLKIDDMFVRYGLDRPTFEAMLNQAGPWRMQ